MANAAIEQEIDRLYQLPPNDFTAARNELAKQLGGDAGKRVRALPKPSTSAWAVNQLYWRDRKIYDALVQASERLRAAHRAVLSGKNADLRGADAAHRDAHKAALASIARAAGEAGQQISSAAQNEITRTVERLPVQGPPGRLSKPLSPEGFAALQGTPVAARLAAVREREPESKRPAAKSSTRDGAARERKEQEETAARERERARAERALKAAREREWRDRQTVAKLRKQHTAAAKETAVAQRALDRAQEAEAKLKEALEEAEASLEQTLSAVRDAESAARSR